MSLRMILRSSCDRCSRVALSIALILVRSLLNLSQSRSEMRTDNFIVLLFIVPV
jgi:hypothetical protein